MIDKLQKNEMSVKLTETNRKGNDQEQKSIIKLNKK